MSLEERLSQLIDLSSRRSVIRLNGQKFKNFVGSKSHPRNYSIVVMMTALAAGRQCQICRQASDEFTVVANSWKYSNSHDNSIFFAMVDYDEGSDIFNLLGLNSAPVFLYFSDKNTKVKAADQLDIQRVGFNAEVIAKWVGEKSEGQVVIRVIRPPNYATSLAILSMLALFSVFLYLKRDNLDVLSNRTVWATAAVLLVLVMTSGQMWNHIRGPPLMHRSNKGVSYIHGSSSGQFVLETYIVIVLNGAVALGVILMNDSMRSTSSSKEAGKKRRVSCVIGLALTAVFFSLLLSIFRSKAHGYPYSFMFK